MPRLALLLIALASMMVPRMATAGDLTLAADGGFVIAAAVNGRPVRLRVDPAAPGYIVLNPAAVQRIGLTASMMRSRTSIGPVVLRGHSKAAQVSVAGATFDNRIVWMDRDIVADADGLVSPAVLPYDHVTFALRAAGDGEQAHVLSLQYARGSGLVHVLRLGGQDVDVGVSLQRDATMATAAAGALMSAELGGSWAGAAESRPIAFGVMRPVRPLLLGRPLGIGGFQLGRLLVRTSDNPGGLGALPQESDDPDEIVVTANSRRQRPRYQLTIGEDTLARCSGIAWDKAARSLTLTCAAAP